MGPDIIKLIFDLGETFSFDVNVAGEPAPEKRWLSNGKEMVPSDRIKIVYTSNNTKIYVRSATRKESGVMTLTAENVNGSGSS
jgi:hypothetical protein